MARARTYTVRAFDPAAGELTIDFVHHGDVGLAGPWAAAARPGDPLLLLGPGGAYAPDAAADWHLLVGDESALPAIGAALERVPAGVPVHALVEVDGPADELELTSPGRLDLRWCHRDAGRSGQLVDALAALPFPAGRVHAFVHGEAGRRALPAQAPARRARCAARRPVGVGLLAPRRRRGRIPRLQGGRATRGARR